MLKRCSEMWVFGSKLSEGMAKEIKFAKKTTYPSDILTIAVRK